MLILQWISEKLGSACTKVKSQHMFNWVFGNNDQLYSKDLRVWEMTFNFEKVVDSEDVLVVRIRFLVQIWV